MRGVAVVLEEDTDHATSRGCSAFVCDHEKVFIFLVTFAQRHESLGGPVCDISEGNALI